MEEQTQIDEVTHEQAIPIPVSRLITRLARNLQRAPEWMLKSFDFADPSFERAAERLLQKSQRSIDIAFDLRALITAYAHAVQTPRPNISKLAAAQGISSTGVRRRYSEHTVRAIRHLLSPEPDIQVILQGFPSLEPRDLIGISPSITQSLRKVGVQAEYNPPQTDPMTSALPFLTDMKHGIMDAFPVGLTESHAAEAQKTPAHSLLGQVVSALRNDLSDSAWQDAWAQSATQARFEYAGGLQIDQLLAKLLPFYDEYPKEPQNLISGIHALRVTKHDDASARLEWFINPHVSLYVTRQPVYITTMT